MVRLVVSQGERLLLHLLELDRYRDMAQVPMGMCQEGIAKALRTKVHNVSRALSSLEEDGLVTDRLAHVQGAHRRRRAFALTERGREVAESVRERAGRSTAKWLENGQTKEMTIDEILRKASVSSGRKLSVLEIVDSARRGEALAPSLITRASDERAIGPVIREESHGRPNVGRFFGRVQELSSLTAALSSDEVSIIHVYGMPGIGKSTLLSRIYDGLSGRRSAFWYTFHEWDSEQSFMQTLADFVSGLGGRRISRALSAGTPIADMHPQLVSDLKAVDAVLFLDDVHKIADRMELLLTMLLDAVRASRSVKLVLITRTAIHIVPKHVQHTLSLEVGELDRKSASDLVAGSEVTDPDSLVRDGHGNPMLLSLMASRGVGGRQDVIDFFDSEIYSILPPGERNALELLSVFRHPVMVEALSGVDYETISLLRRRCLVSEQDDGIWLHDLLRNYIIARLNASRKTEAHIAAGNYCERRPEIEYKLEAVYHYIQAGKWREATEVAIANAAQLAEQFPSETLSLLMKIPENEVEGFVFAQVMFLRGQLLEGIGRYEEALSELDASKSLFNESDDRRAVVLETLARLQAKTNELTKAIEAHREALSIYEKSGDVDGMVRERLSIGAVKRQLGDWTEARECYDDALSVATKAENRAAQAACLNNIAILDWEMGKPGDAERRFRESMRFAHSAKDHSGQARVLENYANLCLSFNRMDESGQLLLESSEAYLRAGDLKESKRLRANCAETMANQGGLQEAIEMCRTALSDDALRMPKGLLRPASEFDEGDTLLVLTLISLLRTSGDRSGANAVIEEHLRATEPLNDLVLTAKLKLEQSMIAEESSDFAGAIDALGEAERLLTRAGDSEGLIAVHMRLGTVEEKRGKADVAIQHYSEAARHAEVAANDKARAIALENKAAAEGRE